MPYNARQFVERLADRFLEEDAGSPSGLFLRKLTRKFASDAPEMDAAQRVVLSVRLVHTCIEITEGTLGPSEQKARIKKLADEFNGQPKQ